MPLRIVSTEPRPNPAPIGTEGISERGERCDDRLKHETACSRVEIGVHVAGQHDDHEQEHERNDVGAALGQDGSTLPKSGALRHAEDDGYN